MDIIPVARVEDVLKIALIRMPEAITYDEAAEAEALEAKEREKSGSRITAH
jgi:ATP-dependent Lon protease